MRLVADNFWTYVEGCQPSFFDPVLAYRPDGYYFRPSYKKGHWDGKIRFISYDYSAKKYRFPTGMLDRVISFLESRSWRYTFEDNRTFEYVEPNFELYDSKLGTIIQRDYGQEAIEAALTYSRGILKIATGGGKTVIGSGIVRSIGRRTVWYVHRKTLLHQTRAVLSERLRQPIGIVGDSECELADVTVTMVQTAVNAIENRRNSDFLNWLNGVEVMIIDECHHLESDQQKTVASFTRANWRIGLSATPNLEGPGLILMALCGPILIDIPAWKLIEGGYLVQPYIWFVRMSPVELGETDDWREAYRKCVTENRERAKKVAEVCQVFRYEKRSCLVLVDQKKHGRLILEELSKKGIRSAWITAEVEESQRQGYFNDLKEHRLDCVVAITETMGEGVDIPHLDAVVNATGQRGGGSVKDGESGRRTLQILGRVLRLHPGKHRADYVDFIDIGIGNRGPLDAARSRIETLESEGYAQYIRYWEDYRSP